MNGGKFLGSLLTGSASALVTHTVRQVTPGGYGMKLGAQVATTAAIGGALHFGGAPEHIRDAAIVGGTAAVAVHVGDYMAVAQRVSALTAPSTQTQQNAQQGAQQGANAVN